MFKKLWFVLSVVFNFTPAKNVSKNNILVKSKITFSAKNTEQSEVEDE